VIADGGADTYKAKCAACHGATGAGDTAMGKNLKLRDLGSADVQSNLTMSSQRSSQRAKKKCLHTMGS